MSKRGKWDSSDEEDEDKNHRSSSQKITRIESTSAISDFGGSAGGSSASSGTSANEIVEGNVVAVATLDDHQKDEEGTGSGSGSAQDNDNESKAHSIAEGSIKPDEDMPRSYDPLFDGCRSVECYQRLGFIDQGTYGLVFRAKDIKTGVVHALKQVKLTVNETGKVGFPVTALREINILLALRHPNIVQVKEMVVGSSVDKVFMVMEYCENDLKSCMQMRKQSFSNAEVKRLMIQLLSAMEYMHKKWYVHRDLKTSNLLYSNTGVLSVCDFGLARKYGSPIAPYTFEVVTLWYRAPELLLGSRIYSTPVDMWSVGCIFAEMLLGKPVFPGDGETDQITKIFKVLGLPTEEKWPGFSTLPNVNKVSWRVPSKSKLRDLFPLTSFSGGPSLNDT